MDVSPIFHGVKAQDEMANDPRNRKNRMYLGSIDIYTAQTWAKECGARIGTKEWIAYAKKKMQSGEFSKFQAKPDKVIHNGYDISRV